MLEGRILKGVGGFYYVHTKEGVFCCRAKGLFRKQSLKPLAGDICRIELTHTEDVEGNIVEILPRKNSLIRPPVANTDQALVIFAMHDPEPALGVLDRFTVMMEISRIPTVICVNKDDLSLGSEADEILRIYAPSGYRVLFTSVIDGSGMDELKEILTGRVTSVAGPSGVGKSSMINALAGSYTMETGEVSRKLKRGKQTTRHTELLRLWDDTFIFDSPGFTALDVPDIEPSELYDCFPEMRPYLGRCRYNDCMHAGEPGCAVKEAVNDGVISSERYDSYLSIYNELIKRRRY
ncbi:MAG: ribosome small subunit-dependent GTPase A [Lachnospiraceae bacterium]|nr:ribosome small subunit-dependent GTPase A [Lachnospiraceae bacterium]